MGAKLPLWCRWNHECLYDTTGTYTCIYVALRGCPVAAVLLSIYGRLRQFLGGRASDMACPKRVTLFADVTSLNGAVMSYVTSQCRMCIGHVTFYYKRAANTSVGASCLLFVLSSGSILSPETCVWLVPNTCRSRCI